MSSTSKSTACPKCESADTQSFRMAYNTGVSTGKMSLGGISEGGGLGLGGGKIKTQTGLAAMTAPPKKKDALGVSALIGILGFFLAILGFGMTGSISVNVFIGLATMAICITAAGVHYVKQDKKHKAVFQAQLKKWEASWACLRCGNMFIVR